MTASPLRLLSEMIYGATRVLLALDAPYQKRPLDVGADRIARAASDVDSMSAIEVYSAARAIAYKFQLKGGKKSFAARRRALTQFEPFMRLPAETSRLIENEHCFDALLCILAGADFLPGEAVTPAPDEMDLARKEGWIWVKGES